MGQSLAGERPAVIPKSGTAGCDFPNAALNADSVDTGLGTDELQRMRLALSFEETTMIAGNHNSSPAHTYMPNTPEPSRGASALFAPR